MSSSGIAGVLSCAAMVAMLALAPRAGRATSDREQQARALFDEAEVHYRVGEFAQALAKYKAALKLARRPSLIFNIAQCHRQLREHERALFFYRLYLADWERFHPASRPPNESEVKEHVARLAAILTGERREPAPGRLRLMGAPDGALVTVDGAVRGRAPLPPLALRPGAHDLRVEADGHRPWSTRVTLQAGRELAATVVLESLPRRRGRGWLAAGFVGAGLAAGFEAMAIAFTLKARDEFDDTPEFARARSAAIAGHALAATAALGSALSFVLYARSGRERRSAASVTVAPIAGGAITAATIGF